MKANKILILSSLALLGMTSCGGTSSSIAPSSDSPKSGDTSLSSKEETPSSEIRESSQEESSPAESSRDITVYYTVTFDLNGGKLATGESYVEPQRVIEGHWAKKPGADPVKPNSTFIGWYNSDGVKFDFMTPIYGDVLLIAHYEVNEEAKVTLTINPNNGTGSYEVDTFVGDTISLPIPDAPEGYTFRGWYLDGDPDSPFTGTVTSSVLSATQIVAIYEKAHFNFLFSVDTDGEATITGLIDINSTYITIPSYINSHPVTKISDSAFNSRIYLSEVNIPSTIKYLSAKAFAGANSMMRVNVDKDNPNYRDIDGIVYSKDGTELVYCPHKNADSQSFTIPAHVKRIGEYAFYNQNSYYGGITGINFSEGLEEIGVRAFYNVAFSATSLIFPSTLRKIGDSAFAEFIEGDTQVNFQLNEGLEEIGEDAFIGVYIKGELKIPSTVRKIGDYAFCCPQSSSNAITSVVLPEALEEFGVGVFYNCFGIEDFTLSARNDNFTKVNKSLYSSDMKKLYWVPSDAFKSKDYVLASSTEEIMPRSMGELRYMNKIVLNDGLKRIDDEAFHGSYYLTEIEIPDSVTYLGESAFEYAEKLRSVSIGSGVTEIGRYCFADTGLTSIDIPGNVKKIGDNAFYGVKLSQIGFNEGLEEIGYGSFYFTSGSYDDDYGSYGSSSSSLTEVAFPNSLKSIGDSAFANHDKLDSITFGKDLESLGYQSFTSSPTNIKATDEAKAAGASVSSFTYYSVNKKALYCSPIYNGRIEIKEGTLEIGTSAFKSVKASGLVLPSSLTKIGEGAFESAFNSNEDVDISFPAALKIIDDGAFHFANIDSLTFSEGLESIGEGAFTYAEIASLDFPNTLKSIGTQAFGACTSLTKVNFGTGLEKLADEAFWSDMKISSITLPSSLKEFGAGVFGGYSGARYALTNIKVESGNPYFTSENGAVYSKDFSKLIEVAPGLSMDDPFVVNENTKEIGEYAFLHCFGLRSATLPEGLETIGDYAFSDCTYMNRLSIPASVRYVGERAFERTLGTLNVTFNCSLEYAIENFDRDYTSGSSCRFSYLGAEE